MVVVNRPEMAYAVLAVIDDAKRSNCPGAEGILSLKKVKSQ